MSSIQKIENQKIGSVRKLKFQKRKCANFLPKEKGVPPFGASLDDETLYPRPTQFLTN
jgi:hypothetical protein